MKKYIITLLFALSLGFVCNGQSSDPLVGSCLSKSGSDAKYLKDFWIQLGQSTSQGDFRYKANMSLWKNTKYRFTMCNTEDSKGELILNIKDDANKLVVSSFDQKSGKIYPFIDFVCQKSGIYQLSFDFSNGQQGSGVGIVSMVK
jgi:hypothetical protein